MRSYRGLSDQELLESLRSCGLARGGTAPPRQLYQRTVYEYERQQRRRGGPEPPELEEEEEEEEEEVSPSHAHLREPRGWDAPAEHAQPAPAPAPTWPQPRPRGRILPLLPQLLALAAVGALLLGLAWGGRGA